MQPVLHLYHAWTSSTSKRVRLCLAEKGLTFDGVTLNLKALEQHDPSYLSINPKGVVPALLHQGRIVVESAVINEYLEDAFPQVPLLPADAWGRARARAWTKHLDEDVLRSWQIATWNRSIRPVAAAWKPEEAAEKLARIPMLSRREDWRRMFEEPFTDREVAQAIATLRALFESMDEILSKDLWLAGDIYSLADVNTAPILSRAAEFETLGLTLDHLPNVIGWWKRVAARPAFALAAVDSARAQTLAAQCDGVPGSWSHWRKSRPSQEQ